MSKIKKAFLKWQMILLIVVILLSIVAINPNPWAKGAAIRTVIKESAADNAGIKSALPKTPPRNREVITEVNSKTIQNLEQYYAEISKIEPNETIIIKTNKDIYKLTKIAGEDDLGLKVYAAPTTNIRKGLDLEGGTRVLLQPEKQLSKEEMSTLLDNMKERLNVFGLSDVVMREAGDLSGNQYILIEIAGANEEEVKELIAKQGKFEAKIANDTVFKGGDDIKSVCRTAECSGIDPTTGCGQISDGQWSCRFRFAISLSVEAAKKQAELTKGLAVMPPVQGSREQYLEVPLDLYLDDALVDSLQIAKELKGQAVTEIAISGSGAGTTQQEAVYASLQSMKRLQTVLITGSLPVKLNIVKTDNISPVLGKTFVQGALIMGLIAVLAVTIVLIISYRKITLSMPIAITMIAEVVILFGVAALIKWNIDMAAIAGIIVAVGTGVDDQIIITDETLRGERGGSSYSWKQKLNNAFFIIMAAYFCVVVAMLPLYFAGAGLLRGFALTTIIGVSVGVFITRPAFAAIVEMLVRED